MFGCVWQPIINEDDDDDDFLSDSVHIHLRRRTWDSLQQIHEKFSDQKMCGSAVISRKLTY